MSMIKNKVIVWSMDCFNTLGLMRELGKPGIEFFFLVKGKADFAAHSKYCKQFAETKNVEDGFEFLKHNFFDEKYKPIIITAGDDIVSYLDNHRNELDNRYILPVTKNVGDTEKYTDKNTMTKLAREIGFLCPKSLEVRWNTNIDEVEFPCIIKPSHQKPGHYNEFKFKVCKNKKALKRILQYVRKDSEFIVQSLIPKEKDLLVYGGRMHDGKTVIAGTLIRDRLSDSGSSAHGLLTGRTLDYVNESQIATFLERINYYGLFSVEYGLVDDRAYFFEVNLRNDGTSHDFFQAGANLPLAYVYSAAGMDYSDICTRVTEDKWFIDEIFDIENVIRKKITKKQWKKDMEEATVFKYYDKEDEEPYNIVKRGRNKQILQDIVLNRYRLYIVFVLDKLGLRK